MKIQFTPSAKAQFLDVIRYIQRDNPAAAQGFRDRAGKALQRLARVPDSGRIVPEFPDLPYREVIVAPYRFFYRALGEMIWVVGVWHGAQLPQAPVD